MAVMAPKVERMSAQAKPAFDGFRREVTFFRLLQLPTPATKGLLVVLGAVFVASYLLGAVVVTRRFGELGDAMAPAILFTAKINSRIDSGEWWRLLTNTLQHGSWLHFGLNAYGLFLLGALVERLVGPRRFLLIYALAGVAGALASYWFNPMASVGASGAIFGVFGAAVVLGFKYRLQLPPRVAKALSTGMLPWLALSLAFGLLPMIDNAAHFGGLAVGSLSAVVLGSPLQTETTRTRRILLDVAVGVLALVALVGLLQSVRFGATCLASEAAWESCQGIAMSE